VSKPEIGAGCLGAQSIRTRPVRKLLLAKMRREGGIPVLRQKQLQNVSAKYLNKLISLKNRNGFLEAVKRGTLADYLHNLTDFPITAASDLGLDDEGRLYEEKIDLKNKILSVPELVMDNSKEVSLFNCIVLGDLHIGGKEPTHKIVLDNCMVLGTLYISGHYLDPDLKVTIWRTNCTILKIGSNEMKDLGVEASNVHDCHFFNSHCESLHMTSNCMRFLRLEGFEVTHCDFFHGQIDLSNSFPAKPIDSAREPQDIDWDARANVLLDFSAGADVQSQSIFETLTFLRNRTFIGGDQRSLSDLRYRTALLSQNKISRIFVRLTRGFESPLRFAGIAVVILLSTALIYTSRFCGFVHNVAFQNGNYQPNTYISWGLPVREALYFSCITFTTVGYGDLAPLGITRVFAASEGVLGVIVASSFLVSLVKRYIEK
jgi:hypothetical protein